MPHAYAEFDYIVVGSGQAEAHSLQILLKPVKGFVTGGGR